MNLTWQSISWFILAAVVAFDGRAFSQTVPLTAAHAHNDYRHPRPLLDALDHGFCSVEADVFLVDGDLLVGHDRSELRPDRTLRGLYLDPLKQRVEANGGRVYRDGPSVTLFIDIKRDGPAVYKRLKALIDEYQDMLSYVDNGELHRGAVEIVISGDRPTADIMRDSERYVFVDGRVRDLDRDVQSELVPIISDRWGSHFRWRGDGEIPIAERDKLRSIVDRAHRSGRRVRFWATPENPALWAELLDAGVDLINTDQLDQVREFLLARQP